MLWDRILGVGAFLPQLGVFFKGTLNIKRSKGKLLDLKPTKIASACSDDTRDELRI